MGYIEPLNPCLRLSWPDAERVAKVSHIQNPIKWCFMRIRRWHTYSALFATLTLASATVALGQGYGGIDSADSRKPPWASQLPADGTICVIPDPDSLFEVLQLIRNDSVAKELNLSKEEQKELLSALEAERAIKVSGNPKRLSKQELIADRNGKRTLIVECINEILVPEKAKRLGQLAFQIEVYYLGWANALNRGRLGGKCGIYENQATHINDKVAELEARMQAEMKAVAAKYQKQILEELKCAATHCGTGSAR